MKKKNMKKVIIVALAGVLVVGGCIAWKSFRVSESQKTAQEQMQEQGQTGEATQGEADTSTKQTQDELTERQRQLTIQYSDTEREVTALLSANVWAAASSSATLRFGDASIIESKENSADVKRSYAIAACKLKSNAPDATGEYTTTYTLALDMGDKEHIFTLWQRHSAQAEEQPWTLECDAMSYSATYVRIDAATDLMLDGLNDEIISFVGGATNIEKMHALVKGYCSQYYPSATTATWDKKASIDYGQNTVVLTFSLNNSAKTNLKVLHVLGTDAFEIGK